MDYSIIIPVFNKAELTRNCLASLQATLDGAGEGEVIVIDNASSDETPQVLAEFPWIRAIRNETNRGFAGANNQGAQIASGEFLVLLNNDTKPHPGWLAAMLARAREPGIGAVGARLLFPDGTIQHAGVGIAPLALTSAGFLARHLRARVHGNDPVVLRSGDFQVVTGACLVTPRALYEQLGGLDEGYWNGYEDVDYCLKVRGQGLRVWYEASAVVTHFESQSGPERFRRVAWNVARLGERWANTIVPDALLHEIADGYVARRVTQPRGGVFAQWAALTPVRILFYGTVDPGACADLERRARENAAPVGDVQFADGQSAIAVAREMMERRGDRYVAFVRAGAALSRGWLDRLIHEADSYDGAAAATQGGCTLIALRHYPQHHRLRDRATLEEALADFLQEGIALRAVARAVDCPQVPAETLERIFRETPRRRAGLVSIVMLSWNAPGYTKIALESIRAHTHGDYEVIIVDNGSGAETVEWLRSLTGVRVIYNASNRGFAGGNNQGMAAARGEYVVLLNNDVVVTDGWLDGLLGAFDRIPGLGVSAPRSNIIAGDQLVADVNYANVEKMHEYAAARRERYRHRGYLTDRAIGFCLCIDRRVIDEIGGIDERYAVGNFEDDDFCLRVRAAGYRIYVCDDVFIHHFGSKTFAANKVDWHATMRENWARFAAKWQLPAKQADGGYQPRPAIARGFDRAEHYVPLAAEHAQPAGPERSYQLCFTCVVRDEADWNEAGAFARRYLRAFGADQPVLLAIAAAGSVSAQAIGDRLQRLAKREGIQESAVADIDVADVDVLEIWRRELPAARQHAIDDLDQSSPSALRRLLAEFAPA